MLLFLAAAGIQDFRGRKINTLPFLGFDIALFIYYLVVDPLFSILLIPPIAEFFLKRYSLISYLVLIFPLFFHLSITTISLSYSLLLVRSFGIIIRNFGKGDVKVLQTIAVAIPAYLFLPAADSLFPPVLAVTLVASLIGLLLSIYVHSRTRGETRGRSFSTVDTRDVKEKEKFFIDGNRASYKIPFVSIIAVTYGALFSLSLLLLA